MKSETKRLLNKVHFDWPSPELTLTSPSQGGAASLKNDAYLFKAAKASKEDLDESQEALLSLIGEEFVPLQKAAGASESSSSSSEGKNEEDNINVNKENENPMSENTVTREEFETLQKELAVQKAVNSIAGYKFESDIDKGVAGAIAALSTEGQEAITKAFDTLVARGEASLEKAKEDFSKENPESDLAKSLQDDAGEDGEAEVEVAKTLAERIADRQAQKEAK